MYTVCLTEEECDYLLRLLAESPNPNLEVLRKLLSSQESIAASTSVESKDK